MLGRMSTQQHLPLRHLKLSLVGWMHKDKALLTSNHAIDIILEINHPNIFTGEIRERCKKNYLQKAKWEV